MIVDKLTFINEQMDNLSIPYELGEWTQKLIYPYFVSEFTEIPTMTEDGYEETEVILTGFYRGKYIVLEEIKNIIKKHFCDLRARTDSGSITVNYDGAFPIPTGEKDLKKIQINLNIKEWKGVI